MLFLALSILGSIGFSQMVKVADTRRCNLWAVGAVNYIVACAVCALVAMLRGGLSAGGATIHVGIFGGILYSVSFGFLVSAMRQRGLSVPVAIVRLSVVIPIAASIVIWKETPTVWQAAGGVLLLAALPLLGTQYAGASADRPLDMLGSRLPRLIVPGLFLLTGGCQLASKTFAATGPSSEKAMYLTILFAVAALVCIVVALAQRTALNRHDLRMGAALGMCNVIANFALLAALQNYGIKAILAFPIVSCSVVGLTTAIAAVVWRERLTRPAKIGLVLAGCALVLVNLKSSAG